MITPKALIRVLAALCAGLAIMLVSAAWLYHVATVRLACWEDYDQLELVPPAGACR